MLNEKYINCKIIKIMATTQSWREVFLLSRLKEVIRIPSPSIHMHFLLVQIGIVPLIYFSNSNCLPFTSHSCFTLTGQELCLVPKKLRGANSLRKFISMVNWWSSVIVILPLRPRDVPSSVSVSPSALLKRNVTRVFFASYKLSRDDGYIIPPTIAFRIRCSRVIPPAVRKRLKKRGGGNWSRTK
jgi:hypothetical protein